MKRFRLMPFVLVGVVVAAMLLLALAQFGVGAPAGRPQAHLGSSHRFALADGAALSRPQAPLQTAAVADARFPAGILAGADTDQAVFEDLVVQEGEVIDGGVVVYDGDAHVKNGGRISGDLVVYRGDIRVDEAGRVDGDVSSISGDVRVSGRVGGNLTTWNGDVDLRDGAHVGGDVSVLNGDVKRAAGAEVGGNVVRGPRLDLPPIPAAPFDFGDQSAMAANSVAGSTPNTLQKLGSFFMRLVGMTLLSLLLGVVVWLIAQVRPSIIHDTQATMKEKTALSFVVGILANVVLVLVGGFLAITICLMPLTLATYLLLIALNVAGWAALSYVVSQRVTQRYEISIRWEYAMAVTAAAMAAVLGLLWAMGGCFRFFGFAGMLVVSSIGAGAVLLPFVNRFIGTPEPELPESSSAADENAAVGVTALAEITGPAQPEVAQASDVSADVTAGPARADDFLRIRGIGPVAAGRLGEAGVTTYTALSQLSPEEVGAILNWSPDRVRQSGIIGQAAMLAGERS